MSFILKGGLELSLLRLSIFVLPPSIVLVVIWFVEKAIYGYVPNDEGDQSHTFISYTLKWVASIFAGVISGVGVWALTNRI